MKMFCCNLCSQPINVDQLVYPTCTHCGKYYEPVVGSFVKSTNVYDLEREVGKSTTIVTDAGLAAMIRYSYRELSVDRIEAEGDPLQRKGTTLLRELNRRILFRDA